MVNTQPIEKPVHREDGMIELSGKPFHTIQGEGPFAGLPSVFIRLAGCNLQCPGCDTDYTSDRSIIEPVKLARWVREIAPGTTGLIVITGGEPFRQNLLPLIHALNGAYFKVQIETNGTIAPDHLYWGGEKICTIVCSPKTPEIKIKDADVDAFKYVLKAGEVDPRDGLPTKTLDNNCGVARFSGWFPRTKVYISPYDPGPPNMFPEWEDEIYEYRVKDNLAAAVKSCMDFGYRLSIQQHKVAGLD